MSVGHGILLKITNSLFLIQSLYWKINRIGVMCTWFMSQNSVSILSMFQKTKFCFAFLKSICTHLLVPLLAGMRVMDKKTFKDGFGC